MVAMGRSSFSGRKVTIFGSSGFLGRYVVSRLGAAGCQMVLPYRGDELFMRHLKGMGDLGAVNFQKSSIRSLADIEAAVAGSDTVVNLLGIRSETRRWSYADCHVSFPAVLAEVCAEQGIERLIHMSAVGACADSDCGWLRSKALGEVAVREGFQSATILRAATIFGDEDKFINRMAVLSRHLPFFPLVDGGEAKAQPIFSDDVAKAVVSAVSDHTSAGKTYSLAGPKVYTHHEISDYVFDQIGDPRTSASVPKSVALAGAYLAGLIPAPWMWPDLIRYEAIDTTLEKEPAGTLRASDLGVHVLGDMEEVATRYLMMYSKRDPFVDNGVLTNPPK